MVVSKQSYKFEKMKSDCETILKKLVDKKFLVFTKRGNASILAILKLMKELGKTKILIQDQGGWMTYPQFIQKLKLEEVKIKTDYGLFQGTDKKNAVLLFNSLPGYFALQDMKEVQAVSKKNNLLLVNDVAGSIGTNEAKIGDIIFGSFGRWKPLNVEEGGFIATDNEEYFDFLKQFGVDINFEKLHDKLINLDKRLAFLKSTKKLLLQDLTDFDVLHKDKEGLNIIVRYISEAEREKLIKYCVENDYDYVECPKYIRVLDDAISIEIKRLELQKLNVSETQKT